MDYAYIACSSLFKLSHKYCKKWNYALFGLPRTFDESWVLKDERSFGYTEYCLWNVCIKIFENELNNLYPVISLIEKYRHFMGKIQLLDLGFGTWGIILTWLAENIKIFVPWQIMYLWRRFRAFQHGFECLSWNVLW